METVTVSEEYIRAAEEMLEALEVLGAARQREPVRFWRDDIQGTIKVARDAGIGVARK